MLVLDRKPNEGFWIDGQIFVKILGVRRGRVKIGIDAPGYVPIVREELLSRSAGSVPGERDLSFARHQK